jgi:mono/diheme cytochrome c family protein
MSRSKPVHVLCIILLLLASAALLSSCSSPEGKVADGKRWYKMHNCSSCHGENGGDGRGPDIAGLEMSFRGFTRRLRNTETAIMPEFNEDKINDQDASDILAFLKSIE